MWSPSRGRVSKNILRHLLVFHIFPYFNLMFLTYLAFRISSYLYDGGGGGGGGDGGGGDGGGGGGSVFSIFFVCS